MQRQRFVWLTSLAAALMLALAGVAGAATSGKIVGTVTDAQTGEPVLGATVFIEELRMGAVTDGEGRYFILNVPAGRYAVHAQLIGYSPMVQQGVLVQADLTSTVGFSLTYQAVEIQQVIVTAERPLIEMSNTSTRRTTIREQLEYMPIVTSDDVYRAAPGVVFDQIGGPLQQVTDGTIRIEDENRTGNSANPGLNIRGSREDEVNYYLDNFVVLDPMVHGNAIVLPSPAIEETNVQTGGFSASYGNGTSVINTVTPTPGTKYDLNVDWQSDALPGAIAERYDYGTNIVTTSIGGAVPGTDSRLRFWVLGNVDHADDWGPKLFEQDAAFIENGIREFTGRDNMSDSLRTFWAQYEPWDVFPGDRLILPNHGSDMYTGMAKLIYRVGPLQLNASGFTWRRQYGRFTQNGIFDRWDTANTRNLSTKTVFQLNTLENRKQGSLGVGWALSSRTLFDVKVNYSTRTFTLANVDAQNNSSGMFNDYDFPWHDYAEPWSPFYADSAARLHRAKFVQGARTVLYPLGVANMFFTYGNQRGLTYRAVNELAVDLQGTSQVSNSHEVTAGIDYSRQDVRQEDLSDPWSGTPFFDTWGPFHPVYIGAFAQDKIEYSGMTVTGGFRYDYFDPDAYVWSDPLKPGASEQFPNGRPDVNSDPTGNAYRDKRVSAKTAISPRLGISHPVSDRALIYFNYGHFRTVPQYITLYESYAPDLGRSNSRLGNPDLPLEKSINYEIGYTQEMAANTKIDIVLYYRDMSNITSYERIPAIGGAYTYAMATTSTPIGATGQTANIGYGNTRGMEIMLTKFRTGRDLFSGWLSYSYMKSNVIYSDGNDAYERFSRSALDPQTGQLAYPPDRPRTSDFDRTHGIRGNLDVRFPREFGPEMFGMHPLQNSGISVLETISGGLPYTRINQDGDPVGEPNEFRKPWTYQTDLMLNKNLRLRNAQFSVYMKVENLFDRRNILNVYERTGNPIDDGRNMPQMQPNGVTPSDETWIYEGVKDGIDGSTPDGAISIQEDAVAYRKAWSIYARDPLFFMTPRAILVGVSMSF